MRRLAEILAKKLFKMVLGIILVVVGIAGLFLPIIPGIVLIALGVALLEFHRKDEFIAWLKKHEFVVWLRKNKYIARIIAFWQERKSLPQKPDH